MTESVSISELSQLPGILAKAPGFSNVLAALKKGQSGTLDGAWGSTAALSVASLASVSTHPIVIVIAHPSDLESWGDDVEAFLNARPDVFPQGDITSNDSVDEDSAKRLKILSQLANSPAEKTILLTSIQALMQPVPPPAALKAAGRIIATGDDLPPDDLLRWLIDSGFSRREVVELPGEFTRRGGIIDVYPPEADFPYRLEYMEDTVDSIRRFAPETQRSKEVIDRFNITALAQPKQKETQSASLADYLPKGSWTILVEPEDLREQAKLFLERVDDVRGLFGIDAVFRHLTQHSSVLVTRMPTHSMETTCHLKVESVERFSGDPKRVRQELELLAQAGQQTIIACPSEGEAHRLAELLQEQGTEAATTGKRERKKNNQVNAALQQLKLPETLSNTTILNGHIRAGFRLVEQRLTVIGIQELFRREVTPHVRRPLIRRYETRAIDSFLDLAENDLVVHVNHGIARYRGIHVLESKGAVGEHLLLEFAEGTKLYVPTDKIDLVQKYVGGAKTEPELSRLGGQSWTKRKEKVQEALLDLAAEMIDLQAARQSQPGFTVPEDTNWMQEFEASFAYTETPDQLSAIAEVKNDLTSGRPMDRLLCGDVGYGKTEVALRAAFKVAEQGKQVAVLVPTTILAEQHYRSFSDRLAAYPISVGCLSRFRTGGEQKEIIKKLTEGELDIVVGTHRLLSKDVILTDLGLVVIDEEQRFGVAHKERLKQLRSQVHVLTMSATPIPRTLHQSMLGIRDISNLITPPEGRMPIETRICRFDPDLVRHAIQRELSREGQVYFVHNRVMDIEAVVYKLQQLVPTARIVYGHGQMHEDDLEEVMLKFVRHEADILVATTIIESGLDIPNANTIFIDDAENYGLADLHQLRGRVGRYKHRAYCYLLTQPGKKLTDVAAKRLKAIEEFRELGAGFQIALRDLEIRGAGNLLGTQQSGHIAAIGYELYCSMLEEAVRKLKKQPSKTRIEVNIELPVNAMIPNSYIPGVKAKVEVYRRLSRMRQLERLFDFRDEVADRFGPLPEQVKNLITLQELRILANKWQVTQIHLGGKDVILTYRNKVKIDNLAAQSGPVPPIPNQAPIKGNRLRVVDDHTAYYRLYLENEKVPAKLIELMKKLFAP